MSKEERIQEIRDLIERGGFVCNADAKFLLSELEPQTVAEPEFWDKIIGDLSLMAALCDQSDIADAIRKVRDKLAERIHSPAPDTKGLETRFGKLIEAAKCIRHWHNTGRNDEGMIVSAEHVMKLWEETKLAESALTSYRERK